MKSVLFIFLFLSAQVIAEVRLPAVIGDHMVLQQNAKVKLWGWGNPQEEVKIKASWDSTTYKVKANSGGRWMLTIGTPSAGGPHTVSFKGWNDPIVVNDVLIGEVWVCSGQSNMEWSGSQRLPQSLEEAPKATNTSLRFFYIPKSTSEYPQDDVKAKWVVCSPDEMKKFSAIGYFFGKKINEITGYPMGLISANWGGTPAETWTPAEVVMSDPALKEAAGKLTPMDGWPVLIAQAYNAMIYPILNYNIAGVLWYQGESNVGTNATYASLFTKMIASWRKGWGKEFPFYYVQIAPFNYGNDNINGALLREQQTLASSFPKTGMVIISDLVDTVSDIHPRKKFEVAQRLANLALSETYGKPGIAWKSPSFKAMTIEKNKVRISFNNAENGLITKGGAPTSFYVAGSDGNYMPAQASVEKNGTVLVWNKDIKEPKNVRFGFTNIDMPNLFSKEGLPVDLFRTEGKQGN